MTSPAMSLSLSLDTVPQEVLEHIAFFAATQTFLGPPAALLPLLGTNRRIYARLAISSNHHLYSRIFDYKFDASNNVSRLGIGQITPKAVAHELKLRCMFLQRIRARLDSRQANEENDNEMLRDLLFHAYLMMLDNRGKNEAQLRGYAGMDGWLREYWFDEQGASHAMSSIRTDRWPPNDEKTSLAMWLFWFLLKPCDYPNNGTHTWTAMNVLRIFGLAAHKYNLASPSWVDFVPNARSKASTDVIYFSKSFRLDPPPLATPAILSFLKLVNRMSLGPECSVPFTPWEALKGPKQFHEWECDWGRCLSLGNGDFDKILTDSFTPGSVEGVWEGLFTYTEFTAYAAILAGAPPMVLQKSMVVRHQQTWKLREHHLIGSDSSHSDSGIDMDLDNAEPLSAGDPLRSYFPTGTQIKESRRGVEVREPGAKQVLCYHRASLLADKIKQGDVIAKFAVLDIILTGEGHSAWGSFNLVGRVRPCDGFISLSKEYVDGDRGKWLYRGYLVGNVNGNLAGRWRDTLSPADVPGYEGCFAMSRRR